MKQCNRNKSINNNVKYGSKKKFYEEKLKPIINVNIVFLFRKIEKIRPAVVVLQFA